MGERVFTCANELKPFGLVGLQTNYTELNEDGASHGCDTGYNSLIVQFVHNNVHLFVNLNPTLAFALTLARGSKAFKGSRPSTYFTFLSVASASPCAFERMASGSANSDRSEISSLTRHREISARLQSMRTCFALVK